MLVISGFLLKVIWLGQGDKVCVACSSRLTGDFITIQSISRPDSPAIQM